VPRSPLFDPLFAALKARFAAQGLGPTFPGGFHLGDVPPPPGNAAGPGPLPYLRVVPVAARPKMRTKTSKNLDLEFQLEVAADSFSALDAALTAAGAATENAPLAPEGMSVKKIVEGDTLYDEKDVPADVWVGRTTFLAEVGIDFTPSPG
jgi:hypothetical protein